MVDTDGITLNDPFAMKQSSGGGVGVGRYSAGGVAHVLFSVGVGSSTVLQDLLRRMNDGGMPTRDISGIEAAQVGSRQQFRPYAYHTAAASFRCWIFAKTIGVTLVAALVWV